MISEGFIEKMILDRRLVKMTQVYQVSQEEKTTGTNALKHERSCLACLRNSTEIRAVGRKEGKVRVMGDFF